MKCPRCKVRNNQLGHNTTLVRIRVREITDKDGRVIEERVSRKEYPGQVCALCAVEEGRSYVNYTRG